MTKKPNAIYEPGELGRVRDKLGDIDMNEAKRMAKILGGEVGTEKAREPVHTPSGKLSRKADASSGRKRKSRGRPILTLEDEDELSGLDKIKRVLKNDPGDDPSRKTGASYLQRIKMDRFAAHPEFEIKNQLQLVSSVFPFIGNGADHINSAFTSKRMNAYYNKIGQLVSSTRILFPRNDARRSERMKRASHYVYSILNTIRQWDIELIGKTLASLQSHPRSVALNEYAPVVKAIYRPMFILEKLDPEFHIKGSYNVLRRLLQIENPTDSQTKTQQLIQSAIAAYGDITREVHYCLYPMLMKLISDRWFTYDEFFFRRHRRFLAFIEATDENQIKPVDVDFGGLDFSKVMSSDGGETQDQLQDEEPETATESMETVIKKAMETEAVAERKALGQSFKVLESLFPKAGWDRLSEYPDLYPYFVGIYGLRRGYEYIAPGDPLQQIAVLMHIIEDLCSGLRYVPFSNITSNEGETVFLSEIIPEVANDWRVHIDESFTKDYLPRLCEYCRMLEHSPESRNSPYAKRTLNDLRWAKRLYFLPYYKFASSGPPSFQKTEVSPVYSEVRNFRRHLTTVASNIERWNHAGGAAANVKCDGLDSPLARYKFDIANPVSKRMDALLPPGRRNNVHLVFFSLAAVTVLDYLINGESSWAYDRQASDAVFRGAQADAGVPAFGIDEQIDADRIFTETLKESRKAQKQAAPEASQ
jgi:hypothetical protein